MEKLFAVLFTFFFALNVAAAATTNCTPTQIHISPATSQDDTLSAVSIVWVTDDECDTNSLLYGKTGSTLEAVKTTIVLFDYPVTEKTLPAVSKYYHRAYLTALLPEQQYMYVIVDTSNGSSSHGETFRAPKAVNSPYPINFLTLGDWGRCPTAYSTAEAMFPEKANNDMIFFLGDMSYDLHDLNGTNGDLWFEELQYLFQGFPMLSLPGNHEDFDAFIHYKHRMLMPNFEETENMYYAYRVGPVFFVSISTEYDFITGDEPQSAKQKEWLIKTLSAARADETIEWVIVGGHRPLYCCSYEDDCHEDPPHILYLEPIFHEYKVDIYVCGHTHWYDRMWPTYQGVAETFPDKHVYTNPKYTTYVQTGIAGQQEGYPRFVPPTGNSVFTSSHVGYARVSVSNSTHLYWEELESRTGNVVDYFWIVKDQANHVDLWEF